MHLLFTFSIICIVLGFVFLLSYFVYAAQKDRAYLAEQRKQSVPGSPGL